MNQKHSRTAGKKTIFSFAAALILSLFIAPGTHAAKENQTSKPGKQQTMTIDGKKMTFDVQCILKHAYRDKKTTWEHKVSSDPDPQSKHPYEKLQKKLELLNKAITPDHDKD